MSNIIMDEQPPPLLLLQTCGTMSNIITLSLHAFIAIIIMAFCFGGIIVWFVLERRKRRRRKNNTWTSTSSSVLLLEREKKKKKNGELVWMSTTNKNDDDNYVDKQEDIIITDGPTLVLRGSLELMACQWGGCSNNNHNNNPAQKNSKVVDYLSPEQMTELLFSKGTPEQNETMTRKITNVEKEDGISGKIGGVADAFQSLRLDDDDDDDDDDDGNYNGSTIITATTAATTTEIITTKTQQQQQQQQQHQPEKSFLHLLSLIQKYSVNTSHHYFFNQLFGALDPIALAAEIVALSVNTSVYTYETAPVFTLLEREVMGQIGKLVFEQRPRRRCCRRRRLLSNDEQEQQQATTTLECRNAPEKEVDEEKEVEVEEEFVGEGLMIPGGSLANLTALHAARHRWKVMNGYTRPKQRQDEEEEQEQEDQNPYRSLLEDEEGEEEKKVEDSSCHEINIRQYRPTAASSPSVSTTVSHLYDETQPNLPPLPDLVALVSSEAHYSFAKSARILGLREDDLIVIPTHADGRMDVRALAKKMEELELGVDSWLDVEGGSDSSSISRSRLLGREMSKRVRVPFFVACTAGSTVRGSFDEIAEIVKICREYEARGCSSGSSSSSSMQQQLHHYQRSIWVHVDGAWGGSAIFSSRPSVRSVTHMDEIRHADSFTFNPHKMLGAPQQTTAFIVRHRNALRDANAAGAKYLFDPRKNGAEYDLGDLSYTCGRRTDAVKLWALWKYYGRAGLGDRVDQKVDELALFVEELQKRPSFALACKPWPFNVNFFYFPPRIRRVLEARGVMSRQSLDRDGKNQSIEDYIQIPDDIAKDLANVSVMLKLRLHEAGEMIIPYQPLNNQRADCFRLVLAGKKSFGMDDIRHVLDTMEKYGADL